MLLRTHTYSSVFSEHEPTRSQQLCKHRAQLAAFSQGRIPLAFPTGPFSQSPLATLASFQPLAAPAPSPQTAQPLVASTGAEDVPAAAHAPGSDSAHQGGESAAGADGAVGMEVEAAGGEEGELQDAEGELQDALEPAKGAGEAL